MAPKGIIRGNSKPKEANMIKKCTENLVSFINTCEDQKIWIGIDVHKRNWAVALYRKDGQVLTFSTSSDIGSFVEQLIPWKRRLRRVVYEAGPCGFALARALMTSGIKPGVVAPSRIPRPVSHGAKTDRLDCIKLAEYAAKGQFRRYITIPSEAEEALRSLERHRFQLVDRLRQIKSRIKGLLLQFGIDDPPGLTHWSRRAIEHLQGLQLGDGLKETLHSHLRELEWVEGEIKQVEKQLKEVFICAGHSKRLESLQSIPGVGQIIAVTFMAEIYRPERFQRAEELTSYLGLAPIVVQSGLSKPRSTLRPVGQSRLRSLLVESAWIWKRRDSKAAEFYRLILSRTGCAAKAICALARKLAIIMWRIAIELRPFKLLTG